MFGRQIKAAFLPVLFVGLVSGQVPTGDVTERNFSIPIIVSLEKSEFPQDLSAKDIEIFEKDKRIPISSLDRAGPLTVGILIDMSASMTSSRIRKAINQLTSLIENSNPNNEYFLGIDREDKPKVSLFMQDGTHIQSELKELTGISPKGLTRLYDLLKLGLEQFKVAKHPSVLVLVSDGEDNRSKLQYYELRDLIRKESTLLFAVYVGEHWDRDYDAQGVFNELTGITGGGVGHQKADDKTETWGKDLTDVLKNLNFANIRLVESPKKPKWRELKITLTKDAKKRLREASLRARQGVFL